MRLLSHVLAGLLFAVGLVISGMTQPAKVVGFLDFFGDWDPSLALVMGGAIMVHFVGYRLIMRRGSPVFSELFHLPSRRDLDARLLLGSATFGAGWGLGGYCPGPALTSAIALESNTILFGVSMLVSIYGFDFLSERLKTKPTYVPVKDPG